VKTELITFTTQDKITLAGMLFGDGEPIVILAHMGMPGIDQQSWQPFARLLATKGYTALTFDFRGRGDSGGILEFNKLPYDMDAVIQYLNDHGYTRIVCMGASMGGTACMRAALDHNLVGLGVIASVLSNGKPNEVSLTEVRQLDLPKILVYGLSDFPAVVIDMNKIAEYAPEPKMVQVYLTNAHGTALFNTQYGSHFTELLINFLQAIRSSKPLPTP
jgi:pimeloyl-ACP methyl ester carboxylesterase